MMNSMPQSNNNMNNMPQNSGSMGMMDDMMNGMM
jgi:hypothetical protein